MLSVSRGWTCISKVRGCIFSVKIITFCSVQKISACPNVCRLSFHQWFKSQDMRSAVYVLFKKFTLSIVCVLHFRLSLWSKTSVQPVHGLFSAPELVLVE